MASHHGPINLDQNYVMEGKARTRLFITIAVGLVLTILGIVLLSSGIGVENPGAHGSTHAQAPTAKSQESHGGHTPATQGELTDEGNVEHGEHTAAEGHNAHADQAKGHGESAAHGDHAAAGHDAHAAGGHHDEAPSWTARVWADLWLNAVFFTGLALIGVFFVAVQYVAYAGWSAGLKRVPESFGSFLPIGGVVLLLAFLFGKHDLFHWTHDYLYDEKNPAYDPIMAGKSWYLNLPFYLGRMIFFLGGWYFMWRLLRGFGLKEDAEGANGNYKWYNKLTYWSAAFIVLFAVSTSMAAWDWVMSIDAHWYSTLFGWYTFASWWVSGLATIVLAILLLKEKGLLPNVNENHLHDLGKFMFAFSVFWTYLWFAQYMLIWYANISEETVYFHTRLRSYDGKYFGLFYVNLIVNFFFPFLFLMTRDAKRLPIFLKIAAIAILIGHYLDFYLMIMPGVTKGTSGFGIVELGMLLTFVGLFILVVSNTLAKAPLVAKNHPMLEESLHHHV